MKTTSFRLAVGQAILNAVAASAGAAILILRIPHGGSSFGILAGAAILLFFGALAVTYAGNALRLRGERPAQVGPAPAASSED